ncbi:TPA: nicotinamide-nucleotide amidohydrolase family protein [Candidatus Bipolaricaulota bacterium]|nr:nicotinamide-nucleotide amidohydrolase family protein [Candidatus Bipolaricaulota bacterium]
MREVEVGERLRKLGKTLAVAESCSGGLLAMRITEVPGASDYFLGGIVSYANAAKERLLAVPGEVLAERGAVSPECARAMALGVKRAFGADYALAITGIAGPGGGTPEKPVGLVYIAVAGPEGEAEVRQHRFSGSRQGIRWSATEAALSLLLSRIGSL